MEVWHHKMAYYNNRITTLDELMSDCSTGNHPKVFSFLGVMEDHVYWGPNENNPGRHEFEMILQNGTKSRLRVLYNTGLDQHNVYDERFFDDSELLFYPKGSLIFLPRLDLLYIEKDSLFCQFLGGDEVHGNMYHEHDGVTKIGPNRVMICLETTPSQIAAFVTNNQVI